jgi:serine O-acetyltransferase
VFKLLMSDFRHKAAIYGLQPDARALLRMALNDGSLAQMLFRAMSYCQTHHLKVFAAVLYRVNAMLTHATIGRDATIGEGFVIVHSVGVVINGAVRAGKNLVVYHGVTLGSVRDSSPVLGDDVYIGAGAKVIGGVRVGSRVRIGANAVVVKDVPDDCTVVGVPARVVSRHGMPVVAGDGNPE